MCSIAVRKALHLGNASFEGVDQYGAMIASGDLMNTSRPDIERVLSAGRYKVLLYSGAWDGVVGAAVSEPLYAALNWPGRVEFNSVGRSPYKVAETDVEVAGFAREVSERQIVRPFVSCVCSRKSAYCCELPCRPKPEPRPTRYHPFRLLLALRAGSLTFVIADMFPPGGGLCMFACLLASNQVEVNGSRMVRVVVRKAGHILPADQPRVARDMIERFVLRDRFL
jgi:hypothetical protein